MNRQTNLSSSIHLQTWSPKTILKKKSTTRKGIRGKEINLLSFSIKLRQLEFRRGRRVGNRNIKLKIKLVLEEIMNVPALASPTCPFRIGCRDTKPIVIVWLVHLCIGDQSLVFLFQPRCPCSSISWTCLRC